MKFFLQDQILHEFFGPIKFDQIWKVANQKVGSGQTFPALLVFTFGRVRASCFQMDDIHQQ